MKNNQITDNIIPGLRLLEPSCYQDMRGYYWTVYDNKENPIVFNHDKVSHSKKHVLRGIHGDFFTKKFISCIHGEVYCVVVDNRPKSPTYLKWFWIELSHHNKKCIILDPGLGLSYLIMSDDAAILYKLSYKDNYVDHDSQFTLKWNDPNIGIHWPIKTPILQVRDAS